MKLDLRTAPQAPSAALVGAVPKWLRGRSAKPLSGGSNPPRTSNLLPAAALLLAAASAPAGIVDSPVEIVSRDSEVELLLECWERGAGDETILFAVPSLDLEWEVVEASFRDATGTLVLDSATSTTLLAERTFASGLRARIDFTPLGVLRQVPAARLRYRTETPISFEHEEYFVDRMRVRVRAKDAAPGPPAPPDSALDGATPYRRFLEAALSNPDALDRYRTAPPPPIPVADEAPAVAWQPLPDLSPGFDWLKVPVDEDGLYRIDAGWFRRAGIEPEGVDPATLRVVSLGEEVPVHLTLDPATSFADGQAVVFTAAASDSAQSRVRPYFLGVRPEGEEPLAIPRESGPGGLPTLARARLELLAEEDNTLETRVGSFLSIRGMTWVWKALGDGAPHEVSFDLPGLAGDGEAVLLSAQFYYASEYFSDAIPVELLLNGEPVDAQPLPASSTINETPRLVWEVPPSRFKPAGNSVSIRLAPSESSAASARNVFLDKIEVRYDGAPTMVGGSLRVSTGQVEGFDPEVGGDIVLDGVASFKATAYDLTDPGAPKRLRLLPRDGRTVLRVPPGAHREVLVVEDAAIPEAPAPLRSSWTATPAEDFAADTVVITHPELRAAADRLAAHLRAQGGTASVVDVVDLYERHTGGVENFGAVRMFLRGLLAAPGAAKPHSVVLVGDCTSDGRGLARNGIRNYVPTWSFTDPDRRQRDQFATDQVYAWLSGDDELADVLVGRISVNNEADAERVVDKIISYAALPPQDWALDTLTITDFGIFETESAKLLDHGVDNGYPHRFLRIGDLPWEDNYFLPAEVLRDEDRKVAPLATAEIQRAFDEGTGIINFFGHGAPNLWSNQRVWFGGDSRNSDNLSLTNRERLAFVTSFTCNNGAIDYPMPRWNVCIAEDLVRSEGGAVGVFMPSGPGYPNQHIDIAQACMRAVAVLDVRELGVASELARLAYIARRQADDHSRMYVYLGLPASRLPAPEWGLPVEASVRDGKVEAKIAEDFEGRGGYSWRLESSSGRVVASGTSTESSFSADLPTLAHRDYPLALRVSASAEESLGRGGALIHNRRGQATIRRVEAQALRVHVENLTGHVITETVETDYLGMIIDSTSVSAYFPSIPPRRTRVQWMFPGFVFGPDNRSVEFSLAESAADAPTLTLPPGPVVVQPLANRRSEEAGLIVFDEMTTLDRATIRNGPIPVRIAVGNEGTEEIKNASVLLEAVSDVGEPVGTPQTLNAGTLAPGATAFATGTFPIPHTSTRGVTIRATLPGSGELLAKRAYHSADFPNLAVDGATLRITPERPAQGVTVIVEGDVVNKGGGIAPESRVGLFLDANNAPGEAVPSMTGEHAVDIPALAPRGRAPFRLRWDPFDTVGETRLWVVADEREVVAESDSSDNRVALPLSIRSKWKLVPDGIRLEPAGPRAIRLVATVRNDGETDAQRVAVQFFRIAPQTPQNLIAEVVVPRIAANSSQEVEYLWELTGEDADRPVAPNFTIALKGSLQRVSSLTE